MSARPKWFLNWTAASASAPEGDGRPWGDGSEMAGRQARSLDPWDENCGVRPILGGFEAMSSMAQALQGVIDEAANVSAPFDSGSRKWVNGHVYIADWRFNCLRDLSHENAWLTDPWGSNTTATRDLTAIGLVRKLMQAGIQVRVMLWLPSWLGGTFADLSAHIDDHFYAARLVEAENVRLMAKFGATAPTDPPLGVVALDMRTADVVAPSHHQKQLVVRSPWRDVAFAGGVDLAYTRRDAPVLAGDWQSNSGMPKAAPASTTPASRASPRRARRRRPTCPRRSTGPSATSGTTSTCISKARSSPPWRQASPSAGRSPAGSTTSAIRRT